MRYLGKILWGKVDNQNHKPYLCVYESEKKNNSTMCLSLVDLEYGDTLTLFVTDVDMLIAREEAYWDEA